MPWAFRAESYWEPFEQLGRVKFKMAKSKEGKDGLFIQQLPSLVA